METESRAGWEEEYAAVQDAAGLADLSSWGKLRFSGPDRKKFLNGLLTNDVLNLKPMRGFPCCILTPKGKVQGDFLLYDLGVELIALGWPRAVANLSAGLSKMLMLSQTKLDDVSADFGLFFLAGPKARAALEAVFGAVPPFEPFQVRGFERDGSPVLVLSSARLRPDGFFLMPAAGVAKGLWAELLDKGKAVGLKHLGAEALNVLRVERGLPVFGVDMDEDTIPLEARLEPAISMTKGCYMGQETVSRIVNLGHVNRVLAGLKVEGEEPPVPGTAVHAGGSEIGKVTSGVWSPKFKSVLALAMIRFEQSKPGTKVEVREGKGARRAEVVGLG